MVTPGKHLSRQIDKHRLTNDETSFKFTLMKCKIHHFRLQDNHLISTSLFKAPFRDNLYFFATELPLKLWSVAHFYTTVITTNPPNGQCTRVFVDKLTDMEPAKTTTIRIRILFGQVYLHIQEINLCRWCIGHKTHNIPTK